MTEYVFHEQAEDANQYAADVDGRRLIVSFPRTFEETDPGLATWRACWEDEHLAGVDRWFEGEVRFKHHITSYDVEGVMRYAVAVAPGALPGVVRPD